MAGVAGMANVAGIDSGLCDKRGELAAIVDEEERCGRRARRGRGSGSGREAED